MIALVVGSVVLIGVLAVLWVRRAWLRVEIAGSSMAPTFEPGDQLLARRVDPARLRTGDVVVFDGPAADREYAALLASRIKRTYTVVESEAPVFPEGGAPRRMIKRVAAVPGEVLPLDLPDHPAGSVVPPGRLAVAGDNPADSLDSRHYGFITFEQVVGRAKGE